MKFKKFSCLVAGFGIGIFTAFVTWNWSTLPSNYRIALLLLLAMTLYPVYELTFRNGKQPNKEEDYASNSPKQVLLKSKIKSPNTTNDSQT